VLGRVLSARKPLLLGALTELRSEVETEHKTKLILGSLGSLLKGIVNSGEPIQPLHASFLEFLQDPERSGGFHVKAGSEDEVLATSSVGVMNKLLKFNMCGLESFYVRNHDIVDLVDRVKKSISEHLSYACRHFAHHLSGLTRVSSIISPIRVFSYKPEALSLLDDMYAAQREMMALRSWITVGQNRCLIKQCAKN
jgi:hypothetical protein